MEKEKILNQIKVNKLNGMDYSFLISQLCVLNNANYENMQKVVDVLIMEKKITATSTPQKQSQVEQKNIVQTNKFNYMKFAKKIVKTQFLLKILPKYRII